MALERDESGGGFDPRHLLRLQVIPGFQVDDLRAIRGIEVVSQEGEELVLAFASAEAIEVFEARLATLARDGTVTRKDILFALQDIGAWRPEDRMGRALAAQPPTADRPVVLDVELWPLELPPDRERMREQFERWLAESESQILDQINWPGLVMYRVRDVRGVLAALLRHRDVRTVDLPPRVGLDPEFLTIELSDIPPPPAPPDGAPLVGVLDTGIVAGHPLLGPAVGEAAGFIPPGRHAVDEDGHGTHVAGIGLYSDVADCLAKRKFVPELRLLSGRVFANDGDDQSRFVENAVEEAVRYFLGTYGCRVFCLAYGDRNKVYDGRHVRGLAYALDLLSRELRVLFVVPSGNLLPAELPENPRASYPDYLLEDRARLLDPAPALNAITVGGLANFEADAAAQRYPNEIESLPIARKDFPSPFTRSGFSVQGAIKPDLVAHAGNWAIRRGGGSFSALRLGVLSLSRDFASGRLFRESTGTSAAAPAVAHIAAKALDRVGDTATDLVRALLAAHARWPVGANDLFPGDNVHTAREKALRLLGYGSVDQVGILDSTEQVVTLVAEDEIANDHHHFYEIPLPEDLWRTGQRQREITVALAYSPEVRTTRVDYRASEISYRLVTGTSLNAVSAWFRRQPAAEVGRIGEYANGRSIPSSERNRGTLQRATWTFMNARDSNDFRLFLVVTRHDKPWSRVAELSEAYSLAIVIRDGENNEARLYSQVQAKLDLRAQARVRQRARVGSAG